MKLFYWPSSCAIGVHVLLEEAGADYSLSFVDSAQNEQLKPPFTDINPKAKVPVLLRNDGSVITEFAAIAYYVAKTYPQANLLPGGIEAEIRAIELLDYLIATIHMRGFARINRPKAFALRPEDEAAVQQIGREFVTKGFAVLEPVLGDKEYILGSFSIVEGALFFLENWCRNRANIKMPGNFEAHFDRLLGRPAVQRALKAEGIA